MLGPVSLTYANGQQVNIATSNVLQNTISPYVELPFGAYQFKLFVNGDWTKQLPELPLKPNFYGWNQTIAAQPKQQETFFPKIRTFKAGGTYSIVVSKAVVVQTYTSPGGPTFTWYEPANVYRVITEQAAPTNITYACMDAVNALRSSVVNVSVDGQALGSNIGFGKSVEHGVYVYGTHHVKATDQRGNTVAEKDITMYANDYLTAWVYLNPAGKPDITFSSTDLTSSFYQSNLTSGTWFPAHKASDYNWQARFLNLSEDVPYLTVGHDGYDYNSGQAGGYAMLFPDYYGTYSKILDSTNYTTATINLTRGFTAAADPFLMYQANSNLFWSTDGNGTPYVNNASYYSNTQGNHTITLSTAGNNLIAFQSNPGPPAVIPGALLLNVKGLPFSSFIANQSMYSAAAYTPVAEPGFYSVALVAAIGSSCKKYAMQADIPGAAYIRVFNAIPNNLTITTKGQVVPFLTMLIDPVFNAAGTPQGGSVVGDHLGSRQYFNPATPVNEGNALGSTPDTNIRYPINYEYPGNAHVLAAPAINGLDLSAWAQIASGKHRVLFVVRPQDNTDFTQLSDTIKNKVIIDTTIDLKQGEVYTMETISQDIDADKYGIYLRQENFTHQTFDANKHYIAFMNLSGKKPAEASLGIPPYSNYIYDTLNIFYTYYKGDATAYPTYFPNYQNIFLTTLNGTMTAGTTFYPLPVLDMSYFYDQQGNLRTYTTNITSNSPGIMPYFVFNIYAPGSNTYNGGTAQSLALTCSADPVTFNYSLLPIGVGGNGYTNVNLNILTAIDGKIYLYPSLYIAEFIYDKRKPGVFVPVILLLASLIGSTGCTKTYSTATDTTTTVTQTSQSLVDYLNNNYSFSIFYTALKRVGLDKQLTNNKQFTLLLPDNDAFTRIGISADSINAMDTAVLRRWMTYHIVQGAIQYSDVPQTVDNIYYTIDGGNIYFSKPVRPTGARIMHVNGDTINSFDIRASNGYIQVLNRPLPPPLYGSLQDYINANLATFSLFKQALQKFNLWDSLGSTSHVMTVFAPVNDAFSQRRYPDGKYHTITTDTIAGWNTSKIPQAVFGAYIMPSRVFSTDFNDVSPASASTAYYILPNQTGFLAFTYGARGITGGLLNSTYQVPYYGSPMLQSPGNIITKNGNCVLQAVNDVLMLP
ncbi:hypothetical protein F5148DRAFT_1289546 [Russula earlei]|uniref:Uncharacterized protein n=1 Tax=Russula earlei TaxID=71964 RepID=A0ACC0TYU7_9AGAM|nr:hypothetical protein F5148DRAFT_1289546 [Russula earlei]